MSESLPVNSIWSSAFCREAPVGWELLSCSCFHRSFAPCARTMMLMKTCAEWHEPSNALPAKLRRSLSLKRCRGRSFLNQIDCSRRLSMPLRNLHFEVKYFRPLGVIALVASSRMPSRPTLCPRSSVRLVGSGNSVTLFSASM